MQNAQFGAPSAEIQGSFVAPDQGSISNKTKIAHDPIPMGLNMCTIFAVVSLGTHMESFNGGQPSPKTKLFIGFEFPQHKRKFYEEDTDVRSAAVFDEMTFAAYTDKAKLRKIIEAVCQRKVTDDEARSFDCTKLIGCSLMVNITHYTKKDQTIGEKIESYASIVNMPVPMGYQPENEPWLFYIDPALNNFRTEAFAKLPGFLKKKLIESTEGQDFISRGGLFAKLDNTQQQPQPQQQQYQQTNPQLAQPQAPVAASPKVQMIVNDYTYDAYIKIGWTDQQLVDAGKAKYIQQTPPPAPQAAPAPPAPAGPPAPGSVPASTPASPGSIPAAAPAASQGQGFYQPPSSAPVQQESQIPNTATPRTPAQSFLDDEDDDMPF